MRMIPHQAAGLMLALSLAAPALAHHGWSAYDATRPVRIEAPIAEVHWRNPHAEIALPWEGGNWNVVLAPLYRMEARGLPGPLKPGQRIAIEGYPRQDGTHEIRAERITVDGKTVELR